MTYVRQHHLPLARHVRRGAAIAAGASLALAFAATAADAAAAPSASTGPSTMISSSSATVSGSVNPNGVATSWYVQYGIATNAGYGSQTATKSAGSGTSATSITATLTGLAPATSYHYRVVAVSSAGTTDGSDGVFNTTAAPAVVTGAASHLSASSATLNGIVNPEGLTTSWYFQYGTSTAYGQKTAASSLSASPNNVDVSAGISGLSPQNTYHYRIVASSSAGTTYGSDLMLKTGQSVTLNASVPSVVYGGSDILSGIVTNLRSGDHVVIQAERYNEAGYASIASITTGSGGSWSFAVRPTVRTTFIATADGGSSSPVVVGVRPAVYLNPVARGQLSTKVVSAVSFGEHVLQLQRLSHNLWVTWKYVRLSPTGIATFSTQLPNRTPVRMAIGPFVPGMDQAAPGYLAGFSRSFLYLKG